MIDWSIDFLKTASGASQVYDIDYTSALMGPQGEEEQGEDPQVYLLSCAVFLNVSENLQIKCGRIREN